MNTINYQIKTHYEFWIPPIEHLLAGPRISMLLSQAGSVVVLAPCYPPDLLQ